ncbi:MAG: hypothetical protein AB7P34_17635 [Vicinamibacterales bacterium]
MRLSVVFTAISVMAAAPVCAQSTPTLAGRTTLPAHVMCVDMLVSALPTPVLLIKGAHHSQQRLVMNRGDLAVIGRTPDDGLAIGQRYLIRRLPVSAQLGDHREGGYLSIRTPGWVTITALDDLNAMARVDHACDAIEAGDFLEPYAEVTLPAADAAVPAPDFSERVALLPGAEGRQMLGDGDTFSIARGTEHGVAVGARYAIYRDRKDGKPLVHIGEAIVTDPSPTAAKVMLMTTTDAVDVSRDVAVPRRQSGS